MFDEIEPGWLWAIAASIVDISCRRDVMSPPTTPAMPHIQ